jgi:hypothetical protein
MRSDEIMLDAAKRWRLRVSEGSLRIRLLKNDDAAGTYLIKKEAFEVESEDMNRAVWISCYRY